MLYTTDTQLTNIGITGRLELTTCLALLDIMAESSG